MKIEGWLSFYRADGELRVQPMVHASQDEAIASLLHTLGKYRTDHLQYVCDPVHIKHEDGLDYDLDGQAI